MKFLPCSDATVQERHYQQQRARLNAAGALAEGIKRALEDKRLTALFDAVDDYLYGQVGEAGYPEGHTNPEHLMALRTAFLRASSNRAGGTGEVILRTALRQWQEAGK